MGQIFHSCAYDINDRICCVYDADKFHANCYAHSGSVFSIHYLLRRQPWRIMWGGGYVAIDDYLAKVSKQEVLLGISTYDDFEDFEERNEDYLNKSYYDKVKFIQENSKTWKRISVWDEAQEYFDRDNTHSVTYTGFLLNHTQKQAVDLSDYHKRSTFFSDKYTLMAIDAIPVLTETGGGAQMAYFDGVSAESTEWLAGSWCGDLLQIAGSLPDDYNVINCCFAEVWSRAKYYYHKFGVDSDGLILRNDEGELYEAAALSVFGKRGQLNNFRVELTEDQIIYKAVPL